MEHITEKTFTEFVEGIKKKGISARVKLMEDNELVVECGRNYPDEMFDAISDEAERLGIYENLGVCAESSGGNVTRTQIVNGGPKRYNLW